MASIPVSVRRLIAAMAALLLVTRAAVGAPSSTTPNWPPSGEIVAGESTRVIRLPGSVELELNPGTKLRYVRRTNLALLPSSPATACDSLSLLSGSVQVTVPARKPLEHSVVVLTSHGVGGVPRGGRMTVVASAQGTSVINHEGLVVGAIGGNWSDLPSGSVRTLSERGHATLVHPISPPPSLALDPPLALKIGDTGASTRVRLRGSPDTMEYVVRVAAEGAVEPTLVQRLVTKSPEVLLEGLDSGAYLVQAESLDQYGVPSALSTPQHLRVVGLAVPEGARIGHSGIELDHSQRVVLDDPSGLEVTYDHASTFVPAAREYGWSRSVPKLVRLRTIGQSGEASFRILPRDLRAHIEIGPRLARWPGDDVSLTLWLIDGRGNRVVDLPGYHVEVTVNGEPVAVDWVRHADAVRARVPTRPMPGPWVVRVEVKSTKGRLIGREALEIAPSYAAPPSWVQRTTTARAP